MTSSSALSGDRGPLAFPVTPYGPDDRIDADAYQRHVGAMAAFDPPAWFVGCGTGEFAALHSDEIARLVRLTVDVVGSEVPVYGGAGHGFASARDTALHVAEAGGRGLLLFPPTFLPGDADGYVRFVRGVADVSPLELILYHRAPAPVPVSCVADVTAIDQVVAIKEGLGDIEVASLLMARAMAGTYFLNGMPTAEVFQPALQAMGVRGYSSAVFNFVPEVSWAFHRALQDGDEDAIRALNDVFFQPFLALRRRTAGYAVSLIKVGARLRWGTPDAPRPPLPVVERGDVAELAALIETGLQHVARADGTRH